MVKVIMGVKGTGKTKQMIDLINSAVANEHGNVVCIERSRKLTYDIHYQIRLVDAEQYNLSSFEVLRRLYLRPVRRQLRHHPHLHRQPVQDRPQRLRPRGGQVPQLAGRLL